MTHLDFSVNSLTLKRAAEADVDAILSIERRILTPYVLITTDRDEALEEIRNTNMYLVYGGEELIGLVAYSIRSEKEGHLDELAVFPQFQNKGIGGHILNIILVELRQKGITLVTLETHPENPALRLYQRSGFTVTGRIDNYLSSGTPRLILSCEV